MQCAHMLVKHLYYSYKQTLYLVIVLYVKHILYRKLPPFSYCYIALQSNLMRKQMKKNKHKTSQTLYTQVK